MRLPIALAVSTLLSMSASGQAAAQTGEQAPDGNPTPEVVVDGSRHGLKPYRIMSAGLDAFDEHRKLAPAAALKFRLLQNGASYGEPQKWDSVTLRLAGDEFSIPLPIEADGTFTLPRSQAAFDQDADLVLNRNKSTISYYTKVLTPGLADNVRRMGDLRLQCEVTIAIGKKELNFAQRAFYNTVLFGGDWCTSRKATFGLLLDDWPMKVTLVDKDKRKTLRADGYRLVTPIQDSSLSDEALITFEYWSQASAERKREFIATTPLFLKSSAFKWNAGTPFREVEKGRYVAQIALSRGESKLRLESADGQLALGAPARGDTRIDTSATTKLKYHGGRLVIQTDQPGAYEVSLDLRDPDHPEMAISRAES
ncbi:hypothetical protein GCM10027321_34360 [Massilia terrae]|uniref:Uncharacterized protein n=1 Tax=Massilia terrae TaxID=1811224 RepID=A0ABT2CW23_9BURK|nr:hypothetical protein [Massilia terrae]MCS0658054.1 hypothetical protein [Massilia terrae]